MIELLIAAGAVAYLATRSKPSIAAIPAPIKEAALAVAKEQVAAGVPVNQAAASVAKAAALTWAEIGKLAPVVPSPVEQPSATGILLGPYMTKILNANVTKQPVFGLPKEVQDVLRSDGWKGGGPFPYQGLYPPGASMPSGIMVAKSG